MSMTPTDTARRTNSPPLQGRGKGWGISADTLAELKRRAREMRGQPTEPEKRLWGYLANSRLGGCKFRRQQVIGRAIVDFVCPAAKLIVEVDGDTHADREREARRDFYLRGFGFRVVHVTNHDVMCNPDGVLALIAQALEAVDGPHPNPSPEGEGLESVEAQKLLAISLEGSVG